jgi:hypothetical protein
MWVVVEKWQIQKQVQAHGCAACTYLPVTEFRISVMALAASLIICTLVFFGSKLTWAAIVFSGISAIVAASLMRYQVAVAHGICWPCFASECMFYLIFILIIFTAIFPWLKAKWCQEEIKTNI